MKGWPITSSRWERAWKTNPHTSLWTRGSWSCLKHTFMHACVCEIETNQKRAWALWTHTHTKVHTLYLFDIVACLCTCFNKQNIHLFRSLFSLLCSYLSVMSHESTRTTHTHPYRHRHQQEDKGKKIQTVIMLKGINKPCPFLLAAGTFARHQKSSSRPLGCLLC